MRRVYHRHELWEEWPAGMWRHRPASEEAVLLTTAIEFTGNAKLYGEWMLRVVEAWPYSCEHNLSATNMNRQAWIGHAAVTLAINCPEHVTRLAWHQLSQRQQDEANAQADSAIAAWEAKQAARPVDDAQALLFN